MTLTEIADLLKQKTGFDAESVGMAAITRVVHARMAQSGTQDLKAYYRLLGAADEELQQLIEAVVVPETWFFRDHEAFAAFAHFVRNEWLPRHQSGVLRVLSIPCSTGEEPYSIVMALLDSGLSARRFRVDAMDISSRALAQAKRAVYGKNSFRGQDLGFRSRYFKHQVDGYHLAETVREQVSFQYGNLLQLEPGPTAYDVVFCRNLLIYFDAQTQETTIAKLEELLVDNGVVFVGPAEAFLMRRGKLSPVKQPRTFAFQKVNRKNDVSQRYHIPSNTPRARDESRRVTSGRARKLEPVAKWAPKLSVAASIPAQTLKPENRVEVAERLIEARRLADEGRLADAAAMCEAHLRNAGASAEAYYLLALTRDALGDYQSASECYRKALYLQPDHAEALAHLALLLEKQGDLVGARRLQQRRRRAEQRMKGNNT